MANILIIDDKQSVRELLREELASDGYLVDATGDARSVTKNLKFLKPDLILLDLYMKQNDGWKILSDIKQNNPHLPVLIVTAHDNYMKDPRLWLADGHVIKSMYFDELKKQIKQILQKKTDRLYFDEKQTTSESS